MIRSLALVAAFFTGALAVSAQAQATPVQPAAPEVTTSEPTRVPPPPFVIGGYVEAFYQWNFNRPWNGITNYRGFDNRHDTFTLSNVALDLQSDYEDVIGRCTLQIGHTPSTYYLAEPLREGSVAVNATGPELWKYLQQAYAGYRFAERLVVTAGLFLSPIGPEGMAVRDNWNWSRSNLFFGLPFYHTGVRGTYAVSETWVLSLAAYNGWNSVVDNNNRKSLAAQLTFTRPELLVALLYFGGVERPTDAPEGQHFRNLFDAHASWNAMPWLSLLAEVDAGFERGQLGNSGWVAGALYARGRLLEGLFVAARGDMFYEHVPRAQGVSASAFFWPVPWVSSVTATLDYRPRERVSFRVEYRHDQAQGPMFFGDTAVRAGASSAEFVADQRSQDTVTLGTTAWF